MGKSKKKHNNNNSNSKDQYKISRKHLTDEEIRQYELIGVPDLTQDWLELFNTDMVNDLFTILSDGSNNPKKAKRISKYMKYYGFEDVGLGTNVFVMSNPRYPGVVFKFALDDFGLADNYNDIILQNKIPRYTKVLARHPSSIVTVQERKVVVSSPERMDIFRADILKTLKKLSQEYLIVDLSPNNYLNYGIERNGDWCFIDASDLYPFKNISEEIVCRKARGWDEKHKRVKYCGGHFTYTNDFSGCVCDKCGREVLPLELRPDDKEEKAKMANSIMDGYSFEKRKNLVAEELDAINERHGIKPLVKEEKLPTKQSPKTIFIQKPDKAIEDKKQIFANPDDEIDMDAKSPVLESVLADVPDDGPDDDHIIIATEVADDEEKSTTMTEEQPDVNEDNDTVSVTEESEEDDEGDGEESFFGLQPRTESVEPDEEEIKSLEEEASVEEPEVTNTIDFSVITRNDAESIEEAGIYIMFSGDYQKAWEENGIPLIVSFDDGATLHQMISTKALGNLIKAMADNIEEPKEESEDEFEEDSITK